MTVEVTSRGTLEPTYIQGEFLDFINSLNLASAAGKVFIIATEESRTGDSNTVAFETRNITRIRELPDTNAFFDH